MPQLHLHEPVSWFEAVRSVLEHQDVETAHAAPCALTEYKPEAMAAKMAKKCRGKPIFFGSRTRQQVSFKSVTKKYKLK